MMDNLRAEVQSLVGESVSFRRIVGNSLILYFHGKPGDSNIKSIWIDPEWRYEGNRCVINSNDLPWEKLPKETDDEFRIRFNSICDTTKPLVNSKVLSIEFDDITHDVCIKLNKNQCLRTIVGTSKEGIWTYRDEKKGIKIHNWKLIKKSKRQGK